LTNVQGVGRDHYIGFLDYEPGSARRDPGQRTVIQDDVLEIWANEQIEILRSSGADEAAWCVATACLSDLGLDPTPILHARFRIRGTEQILNLGQIFEAIDRTGISVPMSSIAKFVETLPGIIPPTAEPMFVPIRSSGSFLNLECDGMVAKEPNSFLGCLMRVAVNEGRVLSVENVGSIGVSAIRIPTYKLIIRSGKRGGKIGIVN
jgi:hypothetical protein